MTTVDAEIGWLPPFLSPSIRREIKALAPKIDLEVRDNCIAYCESFGPDITHGASHAADVQSFVIPPGFDPYNGLFGYYPGLAASGMPILNVGSTGSYVAYMQGVLFWKANQPCRPQPLAQSASWGYGPVTRNCVIAFKRFFGIIPSWSTNSTVDAATWSAIQYCANYL